MIKIWKSLTSSLQITAANKYLPNQRSMSYINFLALWEKLFPLLNKLLICIVVISPTHCPSISFATHSINTLWSSVFINTYNIVLCTALTSYADKKRSTVPMTYIKLTVSKAGKSKKPAESKWKIFRSIIFFQLWYQVLNKFNNNLIYSIWKMIHSTFLYASK